MTDKQLQNIGIHRAGDKDLTSLYDLIAAMGHSKETDYFERQLAAQQEGTRDLLLAVYGEALAAYCIMNWMPKYGLFKKLGIPEIQDLNTAFAFRRRGIAAALIAYCEAQARSRGLERMGISVGVHGSYGPAQRLYAKMGYIPDGNGVTYDRALVGFGEFRPVDDQLCLMMVKDL